MKDLTISMDAVCKFCSTKLSSRSIVKEDPGSGNITITLQAEPCDRCMQEAMEDSLRAIRAKYVKDDEEEE